MATILSIVMMLILLAMIFLYVWFVKTLYGLMSSVSSEKRFYPAWLCWLLVVPVLNYPAGWLIFPFAIPKTVKNGSESKEVGVKSKLLFKLGLVVQLCPLVTVYLGGVPMLGVLLLMIWLASLIWYWVVASALKAKYFQTKTIS
jgi:hypothetical protein